VSGFWIGENLGNQISQVELSASRVLDGEIRLFKRLEQPADRRLAQMMVIRDFGDGINAFALAAEYSSDTENGFIWFYFQGEFLNHIMQLKLKYSTPLY